MTTSSEHRRRGLGLRWVGAGLVFALMAPLGMLVVPLAALLLVGPRYRPVTLGLACGLVLWWLVRPGDPPDQLVRAAALLGGVLFTAFTAVTPWTVIHRGLVTLGITAVGAVSLVATVGYSWPEIRWWVEQQVGFTLQAFAGRVSQTDWAWAAGIDEMVAQTVPVLADFFPATVAVQLWAGLTFAAVLYYRVAPSPRGRPPGRFREFRFSEHLGWVAVVALGVVLVSEAGSARLLAANLLAVAGALYATRGVAVAAFVHGAIGGSRWIAGAVVVGAIVFLVPVLVGAVVLGVVDSGLDLRRRWRAAASES